MEEGQSLKFHSGLIPFFIFFFRFFDLLKSQYTFDQEQFIVTLGSGWNIPGELTENFSTFSTGFARLTSGFTKFEPDLTKI